MLIRKLLILLFFLLWPVLAFSQAASLARDEAAIAENIKLLKSEMSEGRGEAASRLRSIISRYPGNSTNIRETDSGEASWKKRIMQIAIGVTKSDVEKVLPQSKELPDGWSMGSGQSHTDTYRLDNTWMVTIVYSNPDIVRIRPKLIKRNFAIYVQPPKDFTGTWICWYVNGQKAYEIEFRDGKYNGTFSQFHDNGIKAVEQHYVNNVAQGEDTGWYQTGKLMYSGQYSDGKQDGKWVHFFMDGTKQSESNYLSGSFHGVRAQWYPNGQMRFQKNYKHGIDDGIDAAWNENGVLQYKREYKDGKVVE